MSLSTTTIQILDLSMIHQETIQRRFLRCEDQIHEESWINVQESLGCLARSIGAWRDVTACIANSKMGPRDWATHTEELQNGLVGYMEALRDVASMGQEEGLKATRTLLLQARRTFHHAQDSYQRDFREYLDAALEA
jgi:hypothetical protein